MNTSWDRYWEEETNRGYWSVPDPAVVKLLAGFDCRKPIDALDLGCGIGRHTIYIAEAGHRVTAVDSSREALEFLRKQATEKSCEAKIKIMQGNYLRKLFPDGSFDLVIAYNVIYHGSRDTFKDAIRLIYRYLRSPGLFFFTCPSRRDDKYGNGEMVAQDTYKPLNSAHPGDIHYFANEADLAEFLQEFQGFSAEVYEHFWDNKGTRQFSSHWQITARK